MSLPPPDTDAVILRFRFCRFCHAIAALPLRRFFHFHAAPLFWRHDCAAAFMPLCYVVFTLPAMMFDADACATMLAPDG